MNCDRCGREGATVHIVKVVKGQKIETWLCNECAKDDQEYGILKSLGLGDVSVDSMISDLVSYINQTNTEAPREEKNLVCPNCRMTYNEFKKSGMLGCSECYDAFREYLIPGIEELQGCSCHTGKVPQNIGQRVILKRKINDLNDKLKRFIETEAYEEAAKVRDEIKILQEKEN